MISQQEIEGIKQDIDLVSLVRSKGVQLTKNGKGYKGKCSFHEEDDPFFSVNPDKNLWNCFGVSYVAYLAAIKVEMQSASLN